MTADTENTPIFTELLAEHGAAAGEATEGASAPSADGDGPGREDTERKA
ncbi:hypothetical protein SAMN05216266_102382 [Amycolatopsis marina]|uniref:Uncharacterized protein n=1 Tax=Amycolatopsis marina TaxID=490629 RepID=A0A1I0X0N5_9PSEU|nr:hypothetical protein [Amycolatopsis marina]SFA94582.1 hypothetical protein SAMN05216266_102382 [Amycolatopsis marina]